MEILPIAEITEPLIHMAEKRVVMKSLGERLDKLLMDFDLLMIRKVGLYESAYALADHAGKAVSLLANYRELLLKDGMIGQLEFKAGIVKTLDENQYHDMSPFAEMEEIESEEEREKKNLQSVYFISTRLRERMHKISLSEEDFYFMVKDLLSAWKCYLDHAQEDMDALSETESCLEELSKRTEEYLKDYRTVMERIKYVVLKNYLFVTVKPFKGKDD